MVWCAAVGCSNYKKKNRDLTFFNFPRDKEIAVNFFREKKAPYLDHPVYYIISKNCPRLCQNFFGTM